MGLITSYNLRSMIVRKGTAAMTAMGIAMVVAVFVMTMAIAQGFRGALVASGSNENAILLRKGATSETVSAVLDSRFATGSMGPHELAKAKGQFAKMTTENARRLLRFWQVRSQPSSPSVH